MGISGSSRKNPAITEALHIQHYASLTVHMQPCVSVSFVFYALSNKMKLSICSIVKK